MDEQKEKPVATAKQEKKEASKFSLKNVQVLYIALAVLLIVSILPWFQQGSPVTDDARHHITKFWYMKYSLETYGKIMEWMPFIYSGWPLTHFYHSLPYYISVPYLKFVGAVEAMKINVVLAILLSAAAMFFSANMLMKSKKIAAIASMFYIFTPLHFEFAYLSGSISRLWGYVFIPLAIAFFIKMLEDKSKKKAVLCAVSFAALAYSNINLALAAGYFVMFYAIYFFFVKEKKITSTHVKNIALMILIAAGLLAFWLVPMYLEKDDTTAILLAGNVFGSSPGATSFQQLFTRAFGRDIDGKQTRGFYFGYAFLAISLIGLYSLKFREKTIFGFLGLLGLLLTLFPDPVKLLPFGGAVNYSIYFMLISIFFLSIIAATFVSELLDKKGLIIALIVLAIFAFDVWPASQTYSWSTLPTENYVNTQNILDAYSFVANQPGNFRTYSLVGEMPFMYTGKSEIGLEWTGYREGAFLPIRQITDKIYFSVLGNVTNSGPYNLLGYMGTKYVIFPCIKDFDKFMPLAYSSSDGKICVYQDPAYSPVIESPARVQITTSPSDPDADAYILESCFGNCTIEKQRINITDVISGSPEELSFQTSSNKDGLALVKISYFKYHWHAYIDGKEVQIRKAWPYYMLIDVPAGEHKVEFAYKDNTTHYISDAISIAALGLTVWLLFAGRKKK